MNIFEYGLLICPIGTFICLISYFFSKHNLTIKRKNWRYKDDLDKLIEWVLYFIIHISIVNLSIIYLFLSKEKIIMAIFIILTLILILSIFIMIFLEYSQENTPKNKTTKRKNGVFFKKH